MGRLWYAWIDIPFSKDIVLFSIEEVAQWRKAKNHLIAHALQEGVVLYEHG